MVESIVFHKSLSLAKQVCVQCGDTDTHRGGLRVICNPNSNPSRFVVEFASLEPIRVRAHVGIFVQRRYRLLILPVVVRGDFSPLRKKKRRRCFTNANVRFRL